jgi:hypothetical protein
MIFDNLQYLELWEREKHEKFNTYVWVHGDSNGINIFRAK